MRKPRTTPSAACSNAAPGSSSEIGTLSSGPAVTESIRAMSRTVRAIGPTTRKDSEVQFDGYIGTRPGDGRQPTTPQTLAGIRRDPPRSPPFANGVRPQARATAEPPDDPPADRSRFQGLRVAPNRTFRVFGPAANSGVFVLPRTIAPACFSRDTSSESSIGT